MNSTHIPAEVFPAGEYLRDELEARGWTISEFAEIIGRPIQAVSEILNGGKEITTATALAFADALGTTPELWLNLQAGFRLPR
ncbi:MAG: HigA family addiction module antitoxin [Acidimicrobiales bacterium]